MTQNLLTDSVSCRFKSRDDLAGLLRGLGVSSGDTVVTYCFIGYRASLSYFVSRWLGYPTRFYDGSYQDWAARGLPTVRGSSPR